VCSAFLQQGRDGLLQQGHDGRVLVAPGRVESRVPILRVEGALGIRDRRCMDVRSISGLSQVSPATGKQEACPAVLEREGMRRLHGEGGRGEGGEGDDREGGFYSTT
jgi:hypothetical protein